MKNNKKEYFIVGLIGLLGLMALCVFFFKERIAFCDTAYQAVYLLMEKKPMMIWMRPAAIIPQFIPLAAIYLHAGLKTVMILHSLSFVIFFSIIYLFACMCSKKTLVFIIIPLTLLVTTNEVFFWPQNEIQQGLVWLGLYAVLLFEDRWSAMNLWPRLAIHFLFILWLQFFHMLMFFPIIFLIIYYYDKNNMLFSRNATFHIIACLVSYGIRQVVGLCNPYERGKFNISALIKNNLPHFFSLHSVHVFFHKIPSAYLVYFAILAIALVWLLVYKNYLRAIVTALFSLGYWILIMISSPEDLRFYTENMLLPLGFIAAVPVVADIIPEFKFSYLPYIFLVIIIFRLGGIYQAHDDYTQHLNMYSRYFDYVKKEKLNGVFVDNKLIDQKKAIMTWASSYESILISSLKSPDSTMVVQILDDPNSLSWGLNADTSLITIYGAWGKNEIPSLYFKLQGGKYEILTKQP